MAEDQPLEYFAKKIPPIPISPPPLPPASQLDVPLTRPPAYSFGPSSQSSNSGYSSLASPHSIASSRTSFTIRDLGQNHINVGIDFGTTYSGVSWAVNTDAQSPDINVVHNWPGGPGGGSDVKVPTEICYKDGGITWGYSIPPEAERLQWFKLLLLKDGALPEKVQDSKQLKAARQLLKKLGKTPVDAIADYLRELWECSLNDIRMQLGNSVDGMPFRIILTIPANWPKDARDEMRKAVQLAGLLDRRTGGLETKLDFVGEPEAAALATFFDGNARRSVQVGDINVGDIVVICDAGGGTVDTVTYEVERAAPNVHLGECIDGGMDLCGSIFLDEGFKKHMEEMIGKDKLSKFSKTVENKLMTTWEMNIKRQYQHGTPEITADLPHEVAKAVKSPKNFFKKGNGSKQLSGDAMRFTANDIVKVFDPVMRDILALTTQQISSTLKKKKRKPKAVVLVGGLGGNKFLYQRLKAEFSAGDIDIIQPQGLKTWSSICRGAVIKGLTFDEYDDQVLPVITSYISKAHYGIAYKVPFDPSKHSEEDKKFDQALNRDMAFNQMEWYSAKGDDVSKGNPVTKQWERVFPESRPCQSFTLKIYECEAQAAPTRMTEDVTECATVPIRFNWNDLVVTEGRSRSVQFELKMTILGLGKLDFATYVGGNLVARKIVNVKVGGGEVL